MATTLAPLLDIVFGGPPPVRFECWDGSEISPAADEQGLVRLRSPDALRRLLFAPGELGLGRAFVAGDVDLEGDLPDLLERLERAAPAGGRLGPRGLWAAIGAARQLRLLRLPPPPPREEVRLRGRRHSRRRDARAVSHHYDVGNDFYRLVLGASMTYSCARWGGDVTDLDAAQTAKHELVCRKLGLHERRGMRLLDVGCGWGSLALHAAARHGAVVVGVTISEEQHELATLRVKEAELDDQVEIRLQDYRDLRGEQFDAISSIGMFEHVGHQTMRHYFSSLSRLLRPGARFLNHAISKVGGSRLSRRGFVGRYVFPDAELVDVSQVIDAMERAGVEVRDVESLREHYARTLRAWVSALEANWGEAVRDVGEARARVWRLYMAGSAASFEAGRISVHQVLGVLPHLDGRSDIPLRRDW